MSETRDSAGPVTDLSPVDRAPTLRDHELDEGTRRRIFESMPASTRRAYESDLRKYAGWCAEVGRTPAPATRQTMAVYASYLADQRLAPSSIDRALAAVAKAHEWLGLAKPDRTDVIDVMRRWRQEYAEQGGRTRKAPPVTITALRAMVATLDPATPIGVRDRAVIVVGFAMGARRSEIAGLDLADLTAREAGIEVLVRRSKTDQDARGRHVGLVYGANIATCPVRSLTDWTKLLALAGHTAGPLFVRIDRHGRLGQSGRGGSPDGRIGAEIVADIVRRAAERAGLDAASAFTGHSLRRGFATSAYRANGDMLRIARHGGWADGSKALHGYIEDVNRWDSNPLIGIGL